MYRVNIKELKSSIRNEYKEKRKKIPPEEKEVLDRNICKRFLSLSSYRYADTILLFSPLKYEIDTSYIAVDAWSKGKKVAYPKCIENNEMVFRYVSSFDELETGSYNIKEPKSDLPLYVGGQGNTVCVLPAIVFDKKGYRLGYGKGYYDRFLSGFKGIKAGLIYSDFIVDRLPHGRYDFASDIVVTEKGVITFAEN